jgi:hypothetical protein
MATPPRTNQITQRLEGREGGVVSGATFSPASDGCEDELLDGGMTNP